MRRHTLRTSVACDGVGLHSGAPVRAVLRPAAEGTGVVFVRRDLGAGAAIPAHPASVRDVRLATRLGSGEAWVGTVEHLLAAAWMAGIDDLRVDVEGPELPALDGSAAPFAELLRRAGRRAGRAPRPVLRILRPLEVRDGERWVRVEPSDALRVECAVDFAHPAIGRQSVAFDALTAEVFAREIAPARTFGFAEDAQALRAAGLARGAGLGNTVVLDGKGVVNEEGLRFPDEPCRHKLLDLLGDLALLGAELRGAVRAERGGHALHRELLRALAAAPEAWRLEPGPTEAGPRRARARAAPPPRGR